jgi:hypothetical protein
MISQCLQTNAGFSILQMGHNSLFTSLHQFNIYKFFDLKCRCSKARESHCVVPGWNLGQLLVRVSLWSFSALPESMVEFFKKSKIIAKVTCFGSRQWSLLRISVQIGPFRKNTLLCYIMQHFAIYFIGTKINCLEMFRNIHDLGSHGCVIVELIMSLRQICMPPI